MELQSLPWDKMKKAAEDARQRSYARYSDYRVGSALLGADGQIYSGCNVENASYGACLCAERSAVSAMIAAGCKRIVAVAVITKDLGTPCGICRQVLMEFAPESGPLWVTCYNDAGQSQSFDLFELLPAAFRLST